MCAFKSMYVFIQTLEKRLEWKSEGERSHNLCPGYRQSFLLLSYVVLFLPFLHVIDALMIFYYDFFELIWVKQHCCILVFITYIAFGNCKVRDILWLMETVKVGLWSYLIKSVIWNVFIFK
jgi:hypothetical protein